MHNKELHDLYLSPNSIRVKQWRRRRCRRHRARVAWKRKVHAGFWWINQTWIVCLGNICEGEILILKFVLNNQDWKPSIGFIWLLVGTSVNAVMELQASLNAGSYLAIFWNVKFSRRVLLFAVTESVRNRKRGVCECLSP
jgi:hypothetical protein